MLLEMKTMDEFFNLVQNSKQNNTPYFCYLVQPCDCVVGGENDLPEDREDIKIYKLKTTGGSIVCKKGDVGVSFLTKPFDNGEGLKETFAKEFVSYLKSKNINAEFTGNDILVDGYKCSGMSLNPYITWKRCSFCIIQISLTVDIPLIQSVCTKPMKKIPKGLADYNITTEEVVEFVKDFFNKYENYI